MYTHALAHTTGMTTFINRSFYLFTGTLLPIPSDFALHFFSVSPNPP